jgi:hypothetical protein
MRKEADQTLFLGHAVFDYLIGDEEGLDAGLDDVRHEPYSTEVRPAVKGISLSACLPRQEECTKSYPSIALPPRPSTTSPNIVNPEPMRQ